MIYFEYFLDENNMIKGWQLWNSEREKDNIEYQEKMNNIKNNPIPLNEMHDCIIKNKIIFNKIKNCNYQLINNEIKTIDYIKSNKELFEEKYPDNEKARILTKALIDPNDSEVLQYITDVNNITEV